MKNSEFVKLVQDRYKWVIFFSIAGFLSATIYYLQFAKRYEAEVTIMIPTTQGGQDKGATEAEKYVFAIQNTMTASRITNFIFSDIMLRHLAEKFDLLYHYKIEKTNPYSWNILMKNFEENIKVERIGDEMIKITFEDINEIVAANVANEIVAKLIIMNKDYVVNSIKQRRDMFAGVVGELNVQLGDQLSQLQNLADEFRNNNTLNDRNFNRIDVNFTNAMSDISKLTDDLMRTQQFYKWSQIAIENNFQDNIFLVNSAYPNKPPLNYLKIICIGLCAAIVAASAVCTSIYMYFTLRRRINAMLSDI